jgi:hypothetical protein
LLLLALAVILTVVAAAQEKFVFAHFIVSASRIYSMSRFANFFIGG